MSLSIVATLAVIFFIAAVFSSLSRMSYKERAGALEKRLSYEKDEHTSLMNARDRNELHFMCKRLNEASDINTVYIVSDQFNLITKHVDKCYDGDFEKRQARQEYEDLINPPEDSDV
jgi:hypothetical protein